MGDDDSEVAAFCRDIRPQLVAVLSLQVGSAAVAEELAQETLVRVWQHWPRVGQLDSPHGWAHRVGLNLARSWWRRRRAEQRAQRRHGTGSEPVAAEDGEVGLRQAVANLPRRHRAALVLTVVAGYSTAEAGEVMGCAPGTVKALCAQARQRLRADAETGADRDVHRAARRADGEDRHG